MLVIKSVVRGHESCAAVFADLYTFPFGTEDHTLWILGIDQNCVHHPVARRSALPFATFIGGLPQAASGASIQSVRMLRILLDQLRAAKYEWYSGVALPVLSRVHAMINAGARCSMHIRRICWVDHDAHHVRVINHAFYNRRPILSAICGLPGQMIRSSVDNVFVFWIKRQGGSDTLPGISVIFRTVDSGQRTSYEKLWIRRSLCESAHGFLWQTDQLPATARIFAAINATAARVKCPGASVKPIRIARVNNDVRDDIVLAGADAAQQIPVLAFVRRRKNMAVRSTEKNLVGIMRVGFERNNCAARGTHLPPLLRRSGNRCRQAQRQKPHPLCIHTS